MNKTKYPILISVPVKLNGGDVEYQDRNPADLTPQEKMELVNLMGLFEWKDKPDSEGWWWYFDGKEKLPAYAYQQDDGTWSILCWEHTEQGFAPSNKIFKGCKWSKAILPEE